MQWNISLVFSAVCFYLLFFAPVCDSTVKQSKRNHVEHDHIHQKTHSAKKFCDPSTQKCSSGFYREQTGPNRGQCVPCSCNGLSNECDALTGNCVNCQLNTNGDRCERCKDGHYGNAADRTCQACPCPFTWNNFALACLDVGSGVVECLCKRGHSGSRCERCALGYYGNPLVKGGSCKPCNCEDGTLNICNSLTGECITSGDSSCGHQCHDCDSCTRALLVDLKKTENVLDLLKRENFTGSHGLLRLDHLEASSTETKTLLGSYRTIVRHLDPKVQQLEADVDVVSDDLSKMIDEGLKTESNLEKVLQKVDGTKLNAEDFLSEAEALLKTMPDLIKWLTEVKPREPETLSENNKARMMEEARRIRQEMRARDCAAQSDRAGREEEETHTLLETIRNMTAHVQTDQTVLNQTADSLMESLSSLMDVAELLSNTQDTVNKMQSLNLKSQTMLQQLEHLHTQLQREQSAVTPVIEDLLKNMTNTSLTLQEIKKEFENLAAQLGSQIMSRVDVLSEAEETAEELDRAAAELQQVLHNATNGADPLSAVGLGAYSNIMDAITAANQSSEAADQALKDVKEGDLVNRATGLKDNSTRLQTEASETQNGLKLLSHTVENHKDRLKKRKDKGESLRMNISTVSDNIKNIKTDDTKVLIESAKTAASTSNSSVSKITERLRDISQEVERATLPNVSTNTRDLLNDADQALKNVSMALPALKAKIKQAEALSEKVPAHANMTESIRRIKDVIEETRNYVNRLSVASIFNGKGHVELHPPRNLKDIESFTAVDLLINRHENNPTSQPDNRRKRRQHKRTNAGFFVFYLGNKNASGDYIGMAIRSNVLICVYKLGGVVHEMETSKITTTTNKNSSNFDRVLFHRVYQDAEVNIMQNFTSQKPVSLSPKRNLPNSMRDVLELDPDSTVFYVGGYPEDFTPPVELRYPKFRGAMKLSYINDNPVCLFNYKHAANMEEKQPALMIPRSELSDYYEGTGYRMAFVKEPHKIKRRLFKFHINSRETNAMLFYIGNDESFFCVFVERGFLVLQGQQEGRELRLQSDEKVSLFDKSFAILVADTFKVHFGQKQISAAHTQTNYWSFYIGGLPAPLRQRYNITAPPLRGCVDHLTADTEIVDYERTIGVSDGCPVSLLGVRSATLNSALAVDSLFVGAEQPLRVSVGFRSTDRHGTLLTSSSQNSNSVHDFHLFLADGYAVFKSDNYTLRSDKRYSDGGWHYLSAVRRPTGLDLSIDNVKVIQRRSLRRMPRNQKSKSKLQGGKFTGCITNLYTRRLEQSFIPADLSSFSLTEDVTLGMCSLNHPQHTEVLPAPLLKRHQKHKTIQAPAGSHCKQQQEHLGEYQLSEEHSWLSYTVPHEDLNYRPHFSLDIKTKSSKGLILHVAGRGVVPLLALYLANGKIKMSLGKNRIIQHKQKSNDGNWHRVEFSVEKSAFHLLVDGVRVTDGHLPNNEGSSLDLLSPVYLGGDPKSKTTKGHNIPTNSIIGCIRDFKIHEELIGKPEASHKTAPCFDRVIEMGTYFGGGHIILDNYFAVGSQFVLAFELRPQRLTGLLFHVRSHKTSFNVFLMETKVGVTVDDGNGAVSVSVTPPRSLCDGKFHLVTVSKQLKVIKLVVDSMSQQRDVPFTSTSHSRTLDALYIGGTTKKSQASVSSPFVGCLRNVTLNGKPVVFETGSRVFGPVSFNRCPAD